MYYKFEHHAYYMGYIVKKITFLIFSISLGVPEKCVTTGVKFLNSVWLIVIIPNYSYTNDLKFFFRVWNTVLLS